MNQMALTSRHTIMVSVTERQFPHLPAFVYTPRRPKGIFQFEIIIHVLVALTASFEFLCHGSTAIIKLLILSVRRPSLDVRI